MNPPVHQGRALWAHVPVAQQAGGGWIDDVLRERVRETGLTPPPYCNARRVFWIVQGKALTPND